MSYKKKLFVGLLVELVVSEGKYQGKYRTRIEDLGEKTIAVGAPIDHDGVVPLRRGTKVKFIFVDEAAAYAFEGKIRYRIAVPIPMLVLELPDSAERIQRRNYFRVPVISPVSFQSVTEQGFSELLEGTMLDLSGGGMRLLTKERVEDKILLHVILTLPEEEVQMALRVFHVEKVEESKNYIVSGEFQDISERERDQIIHYIFDLQRARRQKGQE